MPSLVPAIADHLLVEHGAEVPSDLAFLSMEDIGRVIGACGLKTVPAAKLKVAWALTLDGTRPVPERHDETTTFPSESGDPQHRGQVGSGQQPVPEQSASDRTSKPPFFGPSFHLSPHAPLKPLAAWVLSPTDVALFPSFPCSFAGGRG